MKAEQLLPIVEKGENVRVYFSAFDRTLTCGRFVKLADHDDCVKKGMVRFLGLNQEEKFKANPRADFTKLFSFASIESVKPTTV